MTNYNYYDKLQKKFNNEKKYEMGLFDKPQYNGYNRNAEIKMQNGINHYMNTNPPTVICEPIGTSRVPSPTNHLTVR